MKLSDRLELVVSFVEPAKRAADVGTDHGYVPVELVRRGIAEQAFAMDVRKGPLFHAEENIRLAGLENKIETRLSDGLEKLSPGEADTVIIAGMGGELVIHILENGRHMWDTVNQWILSPQSELHKVRRWLHDNGFVIAAEGMVFEDGKYYTVLDVRRKAGNRPAGFEEYPEINSKKDPAEVQEYVYGKYLIDTKNPVLKAYLKEEEEKLSELYERLLKAADASEGARRSLGETAEKLFRNREVQHEMQ